MSLAALSLNGKQEGSYLNAVTTNYRTAHCAWAGDAVDTLRPFFIVPRTGAREAAEYAQRCNAGFEALTAANAGALGADDIYNAAVEGTSTAEKTEELIAKLAKPYDVMVVGNVDLDRLPAEARYKMLSNVASGGGLVIVYPRATKVKKIFATDFLGAAEILSLVPSAGLPQIARAVTSNELVKTYMFKKGRIVLIDYKSVHSAQHSGLSLTAPNSYTRRWLAEYENNMLLVMRAIRWAAGKMPEVSIECPALAGVPVVDRKPGTIAVELSSAAPCDANVRLRLRNELNEVVAEKEKRIALKDQAATGLEVPLLSAGTYYYDIAVNVTRGGRKEFDNAGSYAFTVASPVGALAIDTAGRESFARGEPVPASLTLERPLPAGGRLVITLADSPYGRIWHRSTADIPANAMIVPFTLNDVHLPTIAATLRCSVERNGMVAWSEKTLFFPNRKREIYTSLCWSTVPEEHLAPFWAAQTVDALGWREGLNQPSPGGTNARIAALFDQRFVPYMVRIGLGAGKTNKEWTQQYSWFFLPQSERSNLAAIGEDQSIYNPKARELWEKGIAWRITNLPSYGPAFYNLGDENFFDYNTGFSPSEGLEYRKFLERRYGSIYRLNAAHHTSYASFADVPHLSPSEAKEKKLFPAWFDHRQFMEKQYADLHHFLAAEIKKHDPQALVGAEGSVPGDLEMSIDGLEFWGPYSDLVMDEVLRSIGGDRIRTLWWGGYVGSHGGRNAFPLPLWRDLLAGNINGSAWFSASHGGSESALGSDMAMAGYLVRMRPHLDEFRRGVAQLLIGTPLRHDGIAILWSHASDSARLIDERAANPRDSMGVLVRHCKSRGLSFDFLTPSMIASGALAKYKVLFLCGASSVSGKDAAAIKAFTASGGTVIADMNPGILDEFLAPVEKNPFADLFGGITLKDLKDPERRAVDVKGSINNVRCSFSAAQALAAPGATPFQVKKHGNGTAVLLNFCLGAAENTATGATTMTGFLADLLAAAGVTPAVRVDGINGERAIVRVRSGNGFDIIGVLADTGDIGKTATVKVPKAGHIYDGRSYLGMTGAWSWKIDAPFKVFTVFAAKQLAPALAAAPAVAPGGSIVIDLASFTPGTVLFFDMKTPDGRPARRERVIVVDGRIKDFTVYFAFNDTPGEHVLSLTDVRTGLRGENRVALK